MSKPKSVDAYIEGRENFQDLLTKLRKLALSTDLKETIKWGMPTYTINGKNVIGISAFKNHAGIWFFQGALLKDKSGVLRNAQEGKTQAMRQWVFTQISELNEDLILSYINEAIDNEKKGKRVILKRTDKSLEMPAALSEAFNKNKKAKQSFDQLTKGRQKDYAEYISSAKREATVQSRLAKILPMIISGIGLNDQYKK